MTNEINAEALQNAEAEHAAGAADPTPAATNSTAECAGDGDVAAAPGGAPGPDIDALIAEAEERGRLKGRNEAIAEHMNRPALWQDPDERAEVTILNDTRPCIWDR